MCGGVWGCVCVCVGVFECVGVGVGVCVCGGVCTQFIIHDMQVIFSLLSLLTCAATSSQSKAVRAIFTSPKEVRKIENDYDRKAKSLGLLCRK